jgi:hypothetical protein
MHKLPTARTAWALLLQAFAAHAYSEDTSQVLVEDYEMNQPFLMRQKSVHFYRNRKNVKWEIKNNSLWS